LQRQRAIFDRGIALQTPYSTSTHRHMYGASIAPPFCISSQENLLVFEYEARQRPRHFLREQGRSRRRRGSEQHPDHQHVFKKSEATAFLWSFSLASLNQKVITESITYEVAE
jgi:hypothetical protein